MYTDYECKNLQICTYCLKVMTPKIKKAKVRYDSDFDCDCVPDYKVHASPQPPLYLWEKWEWAQ